VLYYSIVVAPLTLLNQGNLIHVTIYIEHFKKLAWTQYTSHTKQDTDDTNKEGQIHVQMKQEEVRGVFGK
jgi:hypothetical protein